MSDLILSPFAYTLDRHEVMDFPNLRPESSLISLVMSPKITRNTNWFAIVHSFSPAVYMALFVTFTITYLFTIVTKNLSFELKVKVLFDYIEIILAKGIYLLCAK